MNRIVLFVLIVLLPGLSAVAAAGDGKSKKKKSADAPQVEVDDLSKKKKARRGRRGRRAQGAGSNEPIQTGTGAVRAADPGPSDDPAAEPAPAEEQSLRVTGKVLYGDAVQVRKAAVVDVSKVFAAIPAYQRIQSENVPKHKARYHILVNQANQEFQAAVQAVAMHGAYDLVAEKGGTQGGAPADITKLVLDKIDEK